ncbi:competence protein CoiA [Pseudomonas sp. Snoq117.2]|uniref:competence protein CoiA n=1 Tax=Pseudomonas sp. Snoq117.2 TaxID=1500302 RepID=UPI0008CE3782|nr:competence protein CoiA family protein [Pseudomonas sp. Snoq117.2]SEP37287.1 Competence protein CoiA-like family protein [Pseudomonas sp. Snoq117.2]
MRFANVDGTRSEAQPKLRGICRGCGEEVIAKCGKHVVWHWAHRSLANCDSWWEAETKWHRAWKNQFPSDWQETILHDTTKGEKHIADVKTAHGVVVEFQRSSIDPAEVKLREQFYQRMVWVIDGSKNELDQANFAMSISRVNEHAMAGLRWYGRSKLFARWHTTTPVFIDFGEEYGFWRVCRFDPETKKGVVMFVDRALFVEALTTGQSDFSSGGGPASK